MKDAKIGDTSIAQNIEGIYSDGLWKWKIIYDQMFVVTSI